ncbi:unnamed protein product [Moneuplotes crassus]|uniref:Uncharacterized protein n=1 Tax=Euplotes crassus TaxID=5936 RepID=A0AAD1XCN3_EUPCR|nr:unnamed protein product [Moneuplotes crassus]
MIRLPKCQGKKECGNVEVLVRRGEESCFEQDFGACRQCAVEMYSTETTQPIPTISDIDILLEQATFCLQKIANFKLKYNLEHLWENLSHKHNKFTLKTEELGRKLEVIKIKGNYEKLGCLLEECKELLSEIFSSDLMRQYAKQALLRELYDQKRNQGINLRAKNDAQKAKINQFHDKISKVDLHKLKQEFEQLDGHSDEAKGGLEAIEQNKQSFEASIQALVQQNTEIGNEISLKEQEIREFSEKLDSFREEELKLIEQSHKIITEHRKLKEYIFYCKKPLSYHELGDILENFETGSRFDQNENSSLQLNLRDPNHEKILQSIAGKKLPKMSYVGLHEIIRTSDSSVITKFLQDSVSKDIFEFHLDFGCLIPGLIAEHLGALQRSLPRLSKWVSFEKLHLKQSQFEALVVASRNCERISFNKCRIEIEQSCDFGNRLDNCAIEEFRFNETANEGYSRFGEEGYRKLKWFINGLSKVRILKERAVKFEFEDSQMDSERVEHVFIEAGMNKVWLGTT